MQHPRFNYVKTLMQANQPVLLEGAAGTGKTSIIMQAAESLNLPFFSITGTQQTSVSNLLGFSTVTGDYSKSQLRQAYEFGGVFLIEEIDAMGPNTLICLNSIENGFLSFPDRVVNAHPDFRLCATANPSDQHATFTGRSKLDAATLDRYLNVRVDRAAALEEHLTSADAVKLATSARDWLVSNGVTTSTVTMRDTIRYHKLTGLRDAGLISDDPLIALVKVHDSTMHSDLTAIRTSMALSKTPITEATCLSELMAIVRAIQSTGGLNATNTKTDIYF